MTVLGARANRDRFPILAYRTPGRWVPLLDDVLPYKADERPSLCWTKSAASVRSSNSVSSVHVTWSWLTSRTRDRHLRRDIFVLMSLI